MMIPPPTIKCGVPSKGRLRAHVFDWFERQGAPILASNANGGRYYHYQFATPAPYAPIVPRQSPNPALLQAVELVLLNANDIPRALDLGRIHFGITGRDLLYEYTGQQNDTTNTIQPVIALGIGRADLVLAVPMCWYDVQTLDDFDLAAGAFRKHYGTRLRIATKYHTTVRAFLMHHEIADYQLVISQGATEASVKAKMAEAIADITSTGATLVDNHLRPLQGGVIVRSEAVVWQSRAVPVCALAHDFAAWLVACQA